MPPSDPPPYFERLAAAFVRGTLAARQPDLATGRLFTYPLDDLSPAEMTQLIAIGREYGLRLHKFKRTMELPRVRRVLGTLRGLAPASILDIGSGRGTFLWPLVDAFPALSVHAIDQNPRHVEDLQAVQRGGVTSVSAACADATALPYGAAAFDVVTMLEVLEHIPAAQQALSEAVRVARRFVVLSVPSHEDTNPEHIHLFNQRTLAAMCTAGGAPHATFSYVPGHIIAVVTVPPP
jgi:2-polyprenyl-3-methyl-5-hydroxy-6-metoxy-1,4-benzoquinol methylase